MLDLYIIDEIRKREERQQKRERPSIRIPLPPPPVPEESEPRTDKKPERGSVRIDYRL